MTNDERMRERKEKLVEEAKHLLEAIQKIAPDTVVDPWTDPEILAQAVTLGLLDAPHLCGNPHAAGKVFTQMRDGACVAVELETGKILKEEERISRILNS